MFTLIALLLAAAPTAGTKIQREAEDRARADAADLLRTLCPEQCVLLSVQARVDDEDVGGATTPGFDPAGARTVPVLRAISASVLIDQRLPTAFRGRVKSLVAQRLKSAGVPASVAVEQVSFPVRNPPYLEAKDTPAPPPQLPVAAATPVATPKLDEKLIEHAPLLAVVTLLGGVLLALGGLFFLAARKAPAEPLFAEPLPPEEPAQSAASEAQREAFPAARARRLEKQITDDRALRNIVLREALGRGEHGLVARWVRELGDALLDDLRGDSAVAPALSALSAELKKPADPAARAAALQDLEGRLLAARLSRASDADAFAFLEGVRAEVFVAAWKGLSPGAQEVALRLAPAHLRSAALPELPAEQRQEIALAWVRKPEVSAAYALAAADELRERIANLHAGPAEADRALADLLDSLPRDEQDALLERLRREGDSRSASGLLTESALAYAPTDLLGAALLGVAPARLVAYMGGTDEAVRTHLLAACPARVRVEIEEELGMHRGTGREDFFESRRELLARLREETARRGLQPADIRAWRPRVVSAP
jgi:hypothetical protein